MKGKDFEAMLKSLMKTAEINRRLIGEILKKLDADTERKNLMFEALETRPSWMNYVQAEKVIDDSKQKTSRMYIQLFEMQQALLQEIEGYKEKLKEVDYQPEFGW